MTHLAVWTELFEQEQRRELPQWWVQRNPGRHVSQQGSLGGCFCWKPLCSSRDSACLFFLTECLSKDIRPLPKHINHATESSHSQAGSLLRDIPSPLLSLGKLHPFVLFAPFPFSCSLSKESFSPEASAYREASLDPGYFPSSLCAQYLTIATCGHRGA